MKKNKPSSLNEKATQNSLFQIANKPVENKYICVDELGRDRLLLALLTITSIKGVGFKTAQTLFDKGVLHEIIDGGSGEAAFKWAKLGDNISPEVRTNFAENKTQLLKLGETFAKLLEKENINFIPLGHRDYPESFLRLSAPPRWIFVKGNKDILKSPSIVAVVGTREATLDGQRLAYLCASLLARHNIIVLSGLAKGIDEKAHWGAVDYFGPTIAVLGSGITLLNTPENQRLISRIIDTNGAIISEYLPLDQATRSSFLRRNELQAALSRIVIPVECPSLESGTGATIRRAININTPVIGIITSSSLINDNNLSSTLRSLGKVNAPVFSIKDGGDKAFWSFLKTAMPGHAWDIQPTVRQDSFFRSIERQVLLANTKLGLALDENAINQLSEKLKKLIQ